MPEVLDEILALTGETAQSVGNLTELNPMYRLDIGWSGRVERIDAVRDLTRMQASAEPNLPRGRRCIFGILPSEREKTLRF